MARKSDECYDDLRYVNDAEIRNRLQRFLKACTKNPDSYFTACDMRNKGHKFAEIGERMGVSAVRARVMCCKVLYKIHRIVDLDTGKLRKANHGNI